MQHSSIRLRSVALFSAGFLLASLPAGADVLISNLSGEDGLLTGTLINGSGSTGFNSKAAGFTMPAGDVVTLDKVVLRLNFFDPANDPVVTIYEDLLGEPGSPLVTLVDPALTVGSAGNFDFVPPVPFVLSAGATYWIVVSNDSTGDDHFRWIASSPSQMPTGIATSAGYLFGSGAPPPMTPSSTFNTYEVQGTVGAPLANDACNAAIAVSVPSLTAGTTIGATGDQPPAYACGTTSFYFLDVGVWYTTIGNGNTFTATTCSQATNFDTQISVFCDNCDQLVCVNGNDDQEGPFDPACATVPGVNSNRASTVSFCTQQGATYNIVVHGFLDRAGDFGLFLSDDGTACTGGVVCPSSLIFADGFESGDTNLWQ